MTIGEAIATLRKTIEETSAVSDYTDSYLWSIWNSAKQRIWKNRKTKGQNISYFSYHRFCMKLERVKSHDCGCVSVGCDVLRTLHKIPKPLSGRAEDIMEVTTLSGKLLGARTENQVKSDMLDDIKKKTASYGIYNQYLYVWNNLDYKAIQLNAPWENIMDWNGIQYCEDGTIQCIDVFSIETGVGKEDEFDIIKMCEEMLNLSLQRPDDRTSDRNPEIRA